MSETDNTAAAHESESDARTPQKQSANTYMGVSLRGWAVTAISFVAVVVASGTGLITLYSKLQDAQTAAEQQQSRVSDLSKENKGLTEQVAAVANTTHEKLTEAQKHFLARDHFITFPMDSDPEVVRAEYYPVDGCIHISRVNQAPQPPKGSKTKAKVQYGSAIQDVWITDPSRTVADNRIIDPSRIFVPHKPQVADMSSLHSADVTLDNSPVSAPHGAKSGLLLVSSTTSGEAEGYQGACLNPHPGAFQIYNNQIDACQVQVFRTFADGCRHFQVYNACSGVWAPGVVWQFCANQHRW